MHQVSKSSWKELTAPVLACELPLSIEGICKRHKFKFFEYEECGLGSLLGVVIQINESLFWLMSPVEQSEIGVCVYLRSFEPSKAQAIANLLKKLNIEVSKLVWLNNEI